jgi:CTP synthase (UTP-ammonia lyase)
LHILQIGMIGDFRPENPSHLATSRALENAAEAASLMVQPSWLPTQLLENADLGVILDGYDGLWCAPGSPYSSMDGALQAIRWAREQDRPFFAT